MSANCWTQVASLLNLLKQAYPPFLPHAQHSFFCCLSAQAGLSSEANHHSALLPCCHQLSLFLGNITLSCVTMATVGHHLEACNRETGGKGKEQSRSEPLLVTSNFRGGFFPFYGRGNWGTDQMWNLTTTPGTRGCAPCWQEADWAIHFNKCPGRGKQASKYTPQRVGALGWCQWTKKSLDICFNVLNAARLTTFCIFFNSTILP